LGQVRLGYRLEMNDLLVKRGLFGINEGESCPEGLGRGNMLWGVGWVRLG